jgi:uncharacterized protein YegP (UPF0339 family)
LAYRIHKSRKPAKDLNCAADKAATPDYNDGNWHAWHGGECPVHPESVVEVQFRDGKHSTYDDKAGSWNWGKQGNSTIIAFRVVTPYTEPAPVADTVEAAAQNAIEEVRRGGAMPYEKSGYVWKTVIYPAIERLERALKGGV